PANPAAQPSSVVPVPAPPAPIAVQAAYPPATTAPVPAAAPGPVVCPRCGQSVSAGFTFCGSCGHRMKAAVGAVVAEAVQQAAALAPEPVKVKVRGQLTLIRPDGAEGGSHPLQQGENLIGRGQGHLFDADPYLSPRHADFVLSEGGLEVRDLRSLNGVFVKLTQEEPLESGDTFRIGQELLRFDVISPPSPLEDGTEIIGTPNPGYWGRLSVIVGRDVDGPAFPIFDETIVLGRERGDILFPEDGYVSGTHAQIVLREGRVCLSDMGSSNGTFLRIRDVRAVPTGSLLLMGQQLFRVAYQ
ncbi:MAG: FHA domain-containing protein, partial [Polyangia bacterium]